MSQSQSFSELDQVGTAWNIDRRKLQNKRYTFRRKKPLPQKFLDNIEVR